MMPPPSIGSVVAREESGSALAISLKKVDN